MSGRHPSGMPCPDQMVGADAYCRIDAECFFDEHRPPPFLWMDEARKCDEGNVKLYERPNLVSMHTIM